MIWEYSKVRVVILFVFTFVHVFLLLFVLVFVLVFVFVHVFLLLFVFVFVFVLVLVLHLNYSRSRSSRCLPFHYCYRYYYNCASYFPSFIFWLNCSSLGSLQRLSLLPFLSFLCRVATCPTRLHICRILILARMIIFLCFYIFMFATAALLFIFLIFIPLVIYLHD